MKPPLRLVGASVLFLLLAGCLNQAEGNLPEGYYLPTVEEILDAYAPRQVTLIRISFNDTVLGPLGDDVGRVHFDAARWFEWDGVNKTAIIKSSTGLWLFQNEDIVVLAEYSLQSDRHDVKFHSWALEPDRQTILVNVGGFSFRIVISDPASATLWVGPHNPGSVGVELPNYNDTPWPRVLQFQHDGVLPVLRDNDPEFPRLPVLSNITVTYHGIVTLKVEEKIVADAREDPSTVSENLPLHAQDFLPGQRYGQTMATCGSYLFKSYDPCMTMFEAPVF